MNINRKFSIENQQLLGNELQIISFRYTPEKMEIEITSSFMCMLTNMFIDIKGGFVHIDAYNFMRHNMRTTININDEILKKASLLTGIKEKTNLVKRGLEALISLESSRRLAKLGAKEKNVKNIRRRRSM